MKIDKTGVPTIVTARSTTAGTNLLAPIVTPTPPETSFDSVVTEILSAQDAAAYIVVDPNNRRVTAATGSQATTLKTTVDALATNFAPNQSVTLTPESGATGSALPFNAAVGSQLTNDALIKPLVDSITVAVKPKRSISSILSAALSLETDANGLLPIIVIDQVSGNVKLIAAAHTAIATAMAQVTPAGDQVQVQLSTTTAPATAGKLVFEGGAAA